jgi:4-hydroxythreonine-4-phosphate dehydrogenase
MYHDQALGPLRLYAPEKLVQWTLGIPFVRTSPGHGAAFRLAGKNKADPEAMIQAILLAARLSRKA